MSSARFLMLSLVCSLTFLALACGGGGGGGSTGVASAPTFASLRFVVQPQNVTANTVFPADISVELLDGQGQRIAASGNTVTLSVVGGGGSLSGTLSRTSVAGLATFPGISLATPGSGVQLQAASAGQTASSNVFDVIAQTTTQLALLQQPPDTRLGTSMPSMMVELRDASGQLNPQNGVTMSARLESAVSGLQIGGTTSTQTVNGVASFANLIPDRRADGARLVFEVTAQIAVTSNTFDVLPPVEFLTLEAGFAATKFVAGSASAVKLAEAPDGRFFYNELDTGNIRVIDANGTLLATPFANIPVLNAAEQGLIGLALSPDFASNGHVFVQATVSGPTRQQVIRYTDVGGVGTNATVIVDNLPAASIHNGGELLFLPDGTLLVSVGDANNDMNSQDDASLAGRILRFNADGSVPVDNPDPASPEYVRGIRNTFGLALHGPSGGVFGVENGPTTNDELNFIQAGKNFGWPTMPGTVPGTQHGFTMRVWPTVIAPTSLTWHQGTMFGAEYTNSLFISAYDDGLIYRFRMSGIAFTDIDEELEFAHLDEALSVNNKPLDLMTASDGSLMICTFANIWRIWKP